MDENKVLQNKNVISGNAEIRNTLTNSRPRFEPQFRNRVNPWRLRWSQNLASNFLDPVSRKTFIWNIQTAASETFFFGKTSLQKCKLMCSIFRKARDRPKSVSLHNEF